MDLQSLDKTTVVFEGYDSLVCEDYGRLNHKITTSQNQQSQNGLVKRIELWIYNH
jgi:hypothetical protein